MERAVAKVSAHIKHGASNAMYIGSLREEPTRDAERGGRLAEMTEEAAVRVVDYDPVWGWNVPYFVADDGYGIWETKEGRALLEGRSLTLSTQQMGLGAAPQPAERLSVEEKRENLVAHFSALAELEERRGGLSHLRIIVTVGREVSIGELKEMVNAFLRENFPLCPAFAAIHDDTQHRHAHIYVHARQLDDRKLDLGQDYFRLDESWMRVCAERLGVPEIYTRHIELKEETRGWNDRAEKAAKAEKPLPPKPDRWGDYHDTLLTFRPFDDRWCGRLQAQTRVAEVKVTWLEATKARSDEIAAASSKAQRLRERLDTAAERRAKSKSELKRRMPAEVITVSEQRELKYYERDILNAEKLKAKAAPEPVTTGQTVAQAALPFDGAVAAQGEQLGFDFGIQTEGQERPTAQSRPARTGQKSLAHKQAGAQSSPLATSSTSPSTEETARSLGRELVAETRLAFYESTSGAARTRKEKQQLKEQLAATRDEHAHAQSEAEMCRAYLATQGANEPPYRLTGDERNYLKLVSKHLPESLRKRIERELSRARIIHNRLEDLPTQSGKASISRGDAHPTEEVKEKQSPAVTGKKGYPVAGDRRREDTTRQNAATRATTMKTERPPEPAVLTLSDDKVRRMIVDFELSKARAVALRVAEEDFNAAPHRWMSPTHKVTLADVEARIGDGLQHGQDVRGLQELKLRVQDQIAAERVNAPLRRKEADDEARSLKEHLMAEAMARGRLGLTMPDAVMTPDELRQMMEYVKVSHDLELLRTTYEIELRQVLSEARLTGDGNHVRGLEEKYAGVELMAEVRADRSRRAISAATRNPAKIVLPAKDEAGRDLALTLEQVGMQKGVTGLLKKIVEGREGRRLREQLIEAKDAHLNYLCSDSAGRTAFQAAAQEIARECRERSGQFGYRVPAVPALSREEIAEVRDNARFLTGGRRERWFAVATQSQRMADERDATTIPQRKSVEIFLPNGPDRSLAGAARQEITQERARMERLIPAPSRIPVERERPGTSTTHDRDDQSSHTKPKSSGGRGR